MHGDQVFHFADAVTAGALAFTDAAEVEPQGSGARVPGGADQGGHHLVIHGAAELGVRVADDGDHGRALRFPFKHRFQGAFQDPPGPAGHDSWFPPDTISGPLFLARQLGLCCNVLAKEYDMDMLTTHLLSFLVGLVAGAGVLYWLLPARRQGSQLIRERDEARNALNHYRDQVDRHFLETADLVNDLTQSYRAVHQHSVPGRPRSVQRGGPPQGGGEEPGRGVRAGYAGLATAGLCPKAQGTLSEDFGLGKKKGRWALQPSGPGRGRARRGGGAATGLRGCGQ